MKIINIKNIIRLAALLSVAVLAFALNSVAQAGDEIRQPDLPPFCESLQAPAGNKVSFRVYALGVQVYKWNGASWDFVAPQANLFADAGFNGKIGSHYAGPT